MMHYERYFKPGQRLILRRVGGSGLTVAALDCLAAQLVVCSEMEFQVLLQDTSVVDDLPPGTVYEVLGDIFDFGLRLTACFEQARPDGRLVFKPQGDLEFFFRRRFLRTECRLWLGWQRGGSLRNLRRQWRGWVADPAKIRGETLPKFSLQQTTIGAGGLGIFLPAPVRQDEVLLIFLALDDNQPLICAVAEVAWAGKPQADGLQQAGLQFLNLLDSDRQRIEFYVRRHLTTLKSENEGLSG